MSYYLASDVVDARFHDGVAVATLTRPGNANALSIDLLRDLSDLWLAVASDPKVRCLVLTGTGKHFCAGADIGLLATERTDVGETAAQELAFLPGDVLDVPVIVAVNGTCAGGGLHFVADADIVIAAKTATFLDPHVSVGQVSGIEPVELMSMMRRDKAIRMALLGRHEVLDAAAALHAGLVSEVVSDDGLLDRALELATQVCSGSPEAIRLTRRVIRSVTADAIRSHRDLGWELVKRHWTHPDSHEGPRAFLEKREPEWKTP